MQSIVNIATAKNTVKSVTPAKKGQRMKFFHTYDPITFPVSAKRLFDALELSSRESVVHRLKQKHLVYGQDFVTIRNAENGKYTETYLTTRAARNICMRRKDKALGLSVAERVEGFANKPNTNADLTPIIEDVRRCVESLRNENDSLKKQLADAKSRVAALESNSNESVAEALMRIITGAA